MCTELKQEKYMRAYVEEAGHTALCSLATGAGCSEREAKFIKKINEGKVNPGKEYARLSAIAESGSMKPKLLEWLNSRIAILKQSESVTSGTTEDKSEL